MPPSVLDVVKLSVVVPFYNVQTYALETLRSLRANSRDDFEFLLVDDCSTDGTPEILEQAARDLPGAVLLRHEQNGGLATARNTGLDASHGEYVTFLDGDDWVAPGYFERLVAAIEGLGVDFIRTDHVQFTARERTIHRVPVGRRDEVLNPRDAILPVNRTNSVDYAFAWAYAYHRRLVDRGLVHFTDGLRTAEDRPWIWRLHREAESFAAVGLLGVFYRRGSPRRSPRSVMCGSSISSGPSTRSSRRRRRTGRRTAFCPRPSVRTAPSSPTISRRRTGSSLPWRSNCVP